MLFLVTLVVVYLLGRSVLIPLIARVLKQQGHDPAVRSLDGNIADVLVWVLAIAATFTVGGFGSVIAAFCVFAGAVVLAIGFAAQELLSNFVAGFLFSKTGRLPLVTESNGAMARGESKTSISV